MQENGAIKRGANVLKGKVTFKGVADALDLEFTSVDSLL
jgi:alanine dehydrogenase